MGERSAISWTDATYNPWIGCTRISPGCDHCYAARDNQRHKWVSAWDAERRQTKSAPNVLKWNRQCEISGERMRVFCASLADVFDNEVPNQWRDDLWHLIRITPNLRWMLLTKRIGNVLSMVPPDWPFAHAGIMTTIVNQTEFDRDFPKLAAVPAPWRGISMEPLLGPIAIGDAKPDWIITGGESGAGHREIKTEWVIEIRDQCARNAIAFHHKQWGGIRPAQSGCLVDGIEHKAFPEALI